jgi:GAF domain-containing protein
VAVDTVQLTDPQSASYPELVRAAVRTHPEALASVVASLSWSVTSSDELVEFLHRTVGVATQVIGGASSAGVTAQLGGEPFTAVCTDERTLEVDAAQYAAGDGPCLHAMRTGEVVLVDVDTVRRTWPDFAPGAESSGIHSFLAAPLAGDDGYLGALNLYGTSPDGFTSADAVVLQVLVAHASRSISDYARLRARHHLAEQLREAMRSRAPIEQAKGIMMALHQIDADAAFDLLRSQSQNTNVKLHDVAVEFLDQHTGAQGDGAHGD